MSAMTTTILAFVGVAALVLYVLRRQARINAEERDNY